MYIFMSRSKVPPIKPQTIPRLELLAAVLGSELSKYLSNTLLPKYYKSQIILWSDSQIVLSWISSSKPLRQQFIRHRVQLIRDLTSQSTWKDYSTTSNPADLITRGMNAKAFISKLQYWNQGPVMAYEANTGIAISPRQPVARQYRKLHRDPINKH